MSPTERINSYCHTALSEISNRVVGKILLRTSYDLISRNIFLPMWSVANIVVWSTGQSGA